MKLPLTINCKGKLVDLSIPKVMGILNVTPDSFYDGGKFRNIHTVLPQVERMLREGATFIDIGGYSSRPNANNVSQYEELQRVLPITELVLKEFPDVLLSIDTFRSGVAKECLDTGVSMINDISAGTLDSEMFKIIAQYNVPYVAMHMKGNPQEMQLHTDYKDLLKEVRFYFSKKVAELHALGVSDIILDPGFGFAKTLEQNYELLKQLSLLQSFELPILVGVSRKSMIYKFLNTSANEALNGTTALHMFALQQGAHLLRVHDVREAVECIKLWTQIR